MSGAALSPARGEKRNGLRRNCARACGNYVAEVVSGTVLVGIGQIRKGAHFRRQELRCAPANTVLSGAKACEAPLSIKAVPWVNWTKASPRRELSRSSLSSFGFSLCVSWGSDSQTNGPHSSTLIRDCPSLATKTPLASAACALAEAKRKRPKLRWREMLRS